MIDKIYALYKGKNIDFNLGFIRILEETKFTKCELYLSLALTYDERSNDRKEHIKKAIELPEDFLWSVPVDPGILFKAHIFRGKCFFLLREYDKAIFCFSIVCKIEIHRYNSKEIWDINKLKLKAYFGILEILSKVGKYSKMIQLIDKITGEIKRIEPMSKKKLIDFKNKAVGQLEEEF